MFQTVILAAGSTERAKHVHLKQIVCFRLHNVRRMRTCFASSIMRGSFSDMSHVLDSEPYVKKLCFAWMKQTLLQHSLSTENRSDLGEHV